MAYNLHHRYNIKNPDVMKKIMIKIGRLILAGGFLMIPLIINSQDIKFTRQEKKEARAAERLANFHALDSLIEGKNFVLEADFLENQYGNRHPVSSVLNFVKVEPQRVVMQIGSNSYLGYNGVGGITVEGNMERWKIYKNIKRSSIALQFTVTTNLGTYDISMTVNADNSARAVISGYTRGKLIYSGSLVAYNNSNVYKGQSSY
jgi:hypothetical protein